MAKTRNAVWVLLFTVLSLWAWASTGPPNLDKALDVQYEVVAERPTDPTALNDLGNLLLLADRSVEAEAAYRRALEIDPNSADVRFNLALMLHQNGDLASAERELSSLVEIDPENAWAFYQLGLVKFDRGNRKGALESYARAFAEDPTLTFARNNPHILDNELATEALLLSSRYARSPASRIPRRYGEADRIAELMLGKENPPEDIPSEAERVSEEDPLSQEIENSDESRWDREMGGDAAGEAPDRRTLGSTADPYGEIDPEDELPGAEAGEEETVARRQITNEDLEESSRGSRSAGGYYRPGTQGEASAADGRGRRGAAVRTEPIAPRKVDRPGSSGRAGRGIVGGSPSNVAPLPGRVDSATPAPPERRRRLTGRRSTASLSLDLLPLANPEDVHTEAVHVEATGP